MNSDSRSDNGSVQKGHIYVSVTGGMRNPLVCNVPRVVATSLNELFVCNDPREFAKKTARSGTLQPP